MDDLLKKYDPFNDTFLQDISPPEEKPYPNEHACRLNPPGKYVRFRRRNCFRRHAGKCIDFIFGRTRDGDAELQALRYPKGSWSAEEAKTHCKDKGGSFEAAG